jgi:hypothetical protein
VLNAKVQALGTKIGIEAASKQDVTNAMQEAQRKFLEASSEVAAANSKQQQLEAMMAEV